MNEVNRKSELLDVVSQELEAEKQQNLANFKKRAYKTISPSSTALNVAILNRLDREFELCFGFYQDSLQLNATRYKLTPLHIATLCGNDRAAEKLVAAGADVNATDAKSWTPLHHAALNCDIQMIRFLLDKGAKVCRNQEGGTYEDILKLAYPSIQAPTETIGIIWKDKAVEKRMTQKEFKEITRATYIDENRVSADQLRSQYLAPLEPLRESFSFTASFKEKYEKFVPPVHCLSRVTHDSSGRELVNSPGLGLFAKERVEAQSIIGEYQGLHRKEVVFTPYALGKVDGAVFRNEIPHINDAFPNVGLVHVDHVRGLADRSILVATESISEGGQFCWNYGTHGVKYNQPYVELRPEEARQFIKAHAIEDLVKFLLARGVEGAKLSFEEFGIAEKFRYILETPSVVFSMILDGTLDQNKTAAIERAIHHFQSIPESCLIPGSLVSTARQCLQIKEGLREFSPKTANAYGRYFAQLPSRLRILHVVRTAEDVNKFLLTKIQGLRKLAAENPSEPLSLEEPFFEVWETIRKNCDAEIAAKR